MIIKKYWFVLPILLLITLAVSYFFFPRQNKPPESIIKSSERTPIEKTEIIEYRQTYIPKESQSGSCWTCSNAASGDNAWRCLAESQIYDPCFEADSGQIVCDVNPEKPENGFELKLTEALPEIKCGNGTQDKIPFWVKLENGKSCSGLSKSVSDEEALMYSCGEDKEKIFLIGDGPFDTSAPMWKAKVGYLSDDLQKIIKTEYLNVVKAWR